MKMSNNEPRQCATENNDQNSYVAPAVIYEGKITTRAGSPFSDTGEESIDPADLFSTDE